jgi:hypothetical protein
MPRNVRNFWIALQVDGKQKDIGTGPRKGDGGFTQRIFWRKEGVPNVALRLVGRISGEKKLRLAVFTDNCCIWEGEVER